MSALPPPLPLSQSSIRSRDRKILIVVGISILISIACLYAVIRVVVSAGFTSGIDAKFGDQHLKTTVALLELHKVRYGTYPASLQELKFVGEWDQIALHSVHYVSNAQHDAYFVEVERGWAGKPALHMLDEFWLHTGYSPALKPAKP